MGVINLVCGSEIAHHAKIPYLSLQKVICFPLYYYFSAFYKIANPGKLTVFINF